MTKYFHPLKSMNAKIRGPARQLLGLPMLFATTLAMAQVPQQAAAPVKDLTPYVGQAFALVRHTGTDAPTRIDVVRFDPATKEVKERRATPLDCERVHFARQTIFCLGVPKARGKSGPADFAVLDFRFNTSFAGSVPEGLTVSRARVSPDGAYAGSTIFVTGHAYGSATFSTEALIIELRQRKLTLPPLEYWNIEHNGQRVHPRGINLWGVTFDPTNSDRFYVTVSVGSKIYLAKGAISTRRIEILQADIECPSFSPDGTKLAFKKKRGRVSWAPAMLDLATGKETVFKETRSIDDQIEWLDNHTLVYELNTPRLMGAKTDLMMIDVRNPNKPSQVWLANAGSPAIARE